MKSKIKNDGKKRKNTHRELCERLEDIIGKFYKDLTLYSYMINEFSWDVGINIRELQDHLRDFLSLVTLKKKGYRDYGTDELDEFWGKKK